jgi:hypothetical protein
VRACIGETLGLENQVGSFGCERRKVGNSLVFAEQGESEKVEILLICGESLTRRLYESGESLRLISVVVAKLLVCWPLHRCLLASHVGGLLSIRGT